MYRFLLLSIFLTSLSVNAQDAAKAKKCSATIFSNPIKLLVESVAHEDINCIHYAVSRGAKVNLADVKDPRDAGDYLQNMYRLKCGDPKVYSGHPTVLYCAGLWGKLNSIETLIELGANTNDEEHNKSVYLGAIEGDQIKAVEKAAQLGIKIDKKMQARLFSKANHQDPDYKMVKTLLDLKIIDLTAKGFLSFVMYYTSERQFEEFPNASFYFAEYLVKNTKVDINDPSDDYNPVSPLWRAITNFSRHKKDYRMLHLLVNAGAKLNDNNAPSMNAAVKTCNLEIVDYLLSHKASPHILGFSIDDGMYGHLVWEATPLMNVFTDLNYGHYIDECFVVLTKLLGLGVNVNALGFNTLGRSVTVLDIAAAKEKHSRSQSGNSACQLLRSKGAKTAEEVLIGPHNFSCPK